MENSKWHSPSISEKQLVFDLAQILKAEGYSKKSKNWTKILDKDFILRFCVQSSRFEKNDYDVRVGVSIVIPNMSDETPYGDFYTDIPVESAKQVYEDSIRYFSEWTDKKVLIAKMRALKEWRARNSLEYLRSLPRGAEYEKPPFDVPLNEFILVKYILSGDFGQIEDCY